jgi:hypothetical protein
VLFPLGAEVDLIQPELALPAKPEEEDRFVVVPWNPERGAVGLAVGSVDAEVGLVIHGRLRGEGLRAYPKVDGSRHGLGPQLQFEHFAGPHLPPGLVKAGQFGLRPIAVAHLRLAAA